MSYGVQASEGVDSVSGEYKGGISVKGQEGLWEQQFYQECNKKRHKGWTRKCNSTKNATKRETRVGHESAILPTKQQKQITVYLYHKRML